MAWEEVRGPLKLPGGSRRLYQTVGGFISCYSSLKEIFNKMQEIDSDIQHIIQFLLF